MTICSSIATPKFADITVAPKFTLLIHQSLPWSFLEADKQAMSSLSNLSSVPEILLILMDRHLATLSVHIIPMIKKILMELHKPQQSFPRINGLPFTITTLLDPSPMTTAHQPVGQITPSLCIDNPRESLIGYHHCAQLSGLSIEPWRLCLVHSLDLLFRSLLDNDLNTSQNTDPRLSHCITTPEFE